MTKAKQGGMDVFQACKLKVLEEENARLEGLLADTMFDNAVLKEVTAKLVKIAADECLDETLFVSLVHARLVLRLWPDDYNLAAA